MTYVHHPSAVILAAGYASRMGRFKPLLELGGRMALERVVSLYRSVGVTDIHVVTGFRADDIRAALGQAPVRLVHNPDHDSGMFSSVLAGVRSLPDACPAFFVHPVDIPLVRADTVQRLLSAFVQTPATVVYPMVGDERGHPPLIHGGLKPAILAHDGHGGLKMVLDRFADESLDVPVADEGALLDMDTPADFNRLSERAAMAELLTDRECDLLMTAVCRLPQAIDAHCRQVARIAGRLGDAVLAAGVHLDVARIRCAARIHDLARLEKDHAAAGDRRLRQMGFADLAKIVAGHMDLSVDPKAPLDEAQVVFLADKLVAGTTVVDLSRRFDAKMEKYGQDAAAIANIQRRKQAAQAVQAKITRITGVAIDQMLSDAVSGGCNGKPA